MGIMNYFWKLRPFLCRFLRFISFAPAEKPGRDTGNYGKSRNVPGDHSACANNAPFANRHAGQQDGPCANVRPSSYPYRANLEIGFDNRSINWETGVS
jgi:hypothetical protein